MFERIRKPVNALRHFETLAGIVESVDHKSRPWYSNEERKRAALLFSTDDLELAAVVKTTSLEIINRLQSLLGNVAQEIEKHV
jgi:hypothetical protein